MAPTDSAGPSAPDRTPGCPEDELLDRLREGTLPDAEALEVEDHLRACRRCRERSHELADAAEARAVDREPPPPPRTGRQHLADMLLGGLLAVALAGVAYWLLPRRDVAEPVRTDGAERLSVVVERGATRVPATSDMVLQASDRLHFTFTGTEPGYLALLGLDAAGEVRTYYPATAETAPWSPQSGPEIPPVVPLGAPGLHAFVAVFCAEPHPVAALRQALAKHASTPERFALLTCTLDMVRLPFLRAGASAPPER